MDEEHDDGSEEERDPRDEDEVDPERRGPHPQPGARRRPEGNRPRFERPLVGWAHVTLRRDAQAFLRRFSSAPKSELHLHLEGAVPAATLVRLSSRSPSPIFPDVAAVRARRKALGSPEAFFGFYRDICRQIRSAADYGLVARALTARLARENVRWAEVYVSPAVVERIGLDWFDVRDALERVFREHEARGDGRVRVLLDFVRHWGPSAASRVLDLHEERPWRRVVGVGLGGDETACPARDFAGGVPPRAGGRVSFRSCTRANGPGPNPSRTRSASFHPCGSPTASGPPRTRRSSCFLARKGIVCDVCPTSNLRTGAVRPGRGAPASPPCCARACR